ncbi:hypothetical protein D9M68_575810 [compost metagenome]
MVDQYFQMLARRFLGRLFKRIEVALPPPEVRIQQLLQLVNHLDRRSGYHQVENFLLRFRPCGLCQIIQRRIRRQLVISAKQFLDYRIDDIRALIEQERHCASVALGKFCCF